MVSLFPTVFVACTVMLAPGAMACQSHDDGHGPDPIQFLVATMNQTLQERGPYPHCMPFAETTPNPPFIDFHEKCMCPTPDGSSILCDFLP